MLPTFSKSGVSTVTLSRVNVYPNVKPRVLNQFVGISDANTIKVAVVGKPLQTILLEFQQLTLEDRDNLEVFFTDPLINFGQSPFTYTDFAGVPYTVRYIEPQFALPETTDNDVAFELILTIEG